MPYETRRLRGETVWAHIDEAGKLVADKTGRVEIFYRPGGKAYRASSSNLEPALIVERKPNDEFGGDAPAPVASSKAAPKGRAKHDAAEEHHAHHATDHHALHIYTDGACTGNPGPMGIGVVILGPPRQELGEYLGTGTNNIAELTAILRAIEVAPPDRPLRIHTDSSYAIGVLSKNWKAKANQELIAHIKAAMKGRPRITLVKVAGHAGVPENERCDVLARNAIAGR